MSPLVSQTAPVPATSKVISAEATYIANPALMASLNAANDDEPARNRSILERRRKRWTRRAAH